MNLDVNGHEVPFLYDPGASYTLIDLDVFNSLPEESRPALTEDAASIEAAGQVCLDVRGVATVILTTGTQRFTINMPVVKDLGNPAVLGTNVLATVQSHRCSLERGDSFVELNGERLRLYSDRDEACFTTCTLAAPATAHVSVIQPGGETRIEVPVPRGEGHAYGPRRQVVGRVEALDTTLTKHGLRVAREVVRLDGRQRPTVSVNVINSTDSVQVLPAGEPIATLEPMSNVSDTLSPEEAAALPSEKTLQREDPVGMMTVGASGSPVNGMPVPVPGDTSHIDDLVEKSRTALENDPRWAARAEAFLRANAGVFSKGKHDLGRCQTTYHTIDIIEGERPVKCPPRRKGAIMEEAEAEMVEDMLKHGIVEPCQSPWAAGVVLVTKKDDSLRFCVDYRPLNKRTVKDSWPLPYIQDCFDRLRGATWFTTLDLSSGYWQVELDPKDRDKTAFVTARGQYRFTVLPFGLTNSPATFCRLMEGVLAGIPATTAMAYIDDIIVTGKSFEEMCVNLQTVFDRLQAEGLKLSPKKCEFFRREVPFLGHIASANGIAPDPKKVDKILLWPRPECLSDVHQFVGYASYYRQYIKNFAEVADGLNELKRGGKNRAFEWTKEADASFKAIKAAFEEQGPLPHPNENAEFILDTDASAAGAGAELLQVIDGKEVKIRNWSHSFNAAARNYCTTRRELLAMVEAMEAFRAYLWGRHFTLRTDHASLSWLCGFKNPPDILCRWFERLAVFDFTVVHRPGEKHANADTMSRLPVILDRECGIARRANRPCKAEDDCPRCSADELKAEFCRFEIDPDVDTDPDAPINFKRGEISVLRRRAEINAIGKEDVAASVFVFNGNPEFQAPSLAAAQREDPLLSRFIAILESDDPRAPTYEEQSPEGAHYKALCRDFDRLRIDQGVLCRTWFSEDDAGARTYAQRIVPSALVSKVLQAYHDPPSAGHVGRDRLIDRIRLHFTWPGLRHDVAMFVRTCHYCQQRKSVHRPAHATMQQYRVGAPFERVAMDLQGPMVPSRKLEGRPSYTYLLVVGCYFSKWMEAIPIANKKATTVARAIFSEIFARLGCPFELHTDKGTEFENKVMRELCRLTGIKKTRTIARHPQSDGMIERMNGTIQAMLAAYVHKHQQDWPDFIPHVMSAYRSTVHAATGFTPNFLMFGREIHQPQDINLGVQTAEPCTTDDYVAHVRTAIRDAHDIAREHLAAAMEKTARYYNRDAGQQTYKCGDEVWLYHPIVEEGTGKKKFVIPWEGPYMVTKVLSRLVYRIERPRHRNVLAHYDQLKPYKGTLGPVWFAARRRQLFRDGLIEEDPDTPEAIAAATARHPIGWESTYHSMLPTEEELNAPLSDDEDEAIDAWRERGDKARREALALHAPPPKRKRGRPRKQPLITPVVPIPGPPAPESDIEEEGREAEAIAPAIVARPELAHVRKKQARKRHRDVHPVRRSGRLRARRDSPPDYTQGEMESGDETETSDEAREEATKTDVDEIDAEEEPDGTARAPSEEGGGVADFTTVVPRRRGRGRPRGSGRGRGRARL